jgi:hypothetical protein
MDSTIHARFWRVSPAAAGVTDFMDILIEDAKEPKIGKRERDLGEGVTARLERCTTQGDFLEGEFCRVQLVNFPPQAGPDGLEAIKLGDGNGIGHVAAFRYHCPTRVLLLQRNSLSLSPNRISLYLAATKPGRFFALSPVMAADAMERFKKKTPRSFSVTFAGPDNLAAFDDENIAVAKGARLIAEAYDGIRVTMEVSVGKSRRLRLDKDELLADLGKLIGLGGVKKLKVKAEDGGEEDIINFIKEQMHSEEKAKLPEGKPDDNYEVRKLLLRKLFSDNLDALKEQFK